MRRRERAEREAADARHAAEAGAGRVQDQAAAAAATAEEVARLQVGGACGTACTALPTGAALAPGRAQAHGIAGCMAKDGTFHHPCRLQAELRERGAASERLAREARAASDRAAAAAAAAEEGARARAALAADLSRGQLEMKAKEEEIRGLKVRGGECGSPTGGSVPLGDWTPFVWAL